MTDEAPSETPTQTGSDAPPTVAPPPADENTPLQRLAELEKIVHGLTEHVSHDTRFHAWYEKVKTRLEKLL